MLAAVQDRLYILLGADLVTDDAVGREYPKCGQDAGGTGIAVEHVRFLPDIVLRYATQNGGKLSPFVHKGCPEAIAEQTAEITEHRSFSASDRSGDQDACRLCSDPLEDGFCNAPVFSGDAEIESADVPQCPQTVTLHGCSTADADPAPTPDGHKALCNVVFVAVKRVGADCLKAPCNLLRAHAKSLLRVIGECTGGGEKSFLTGGADADRTAASQADLLYLLHVRRKLLNAQADGRGQIFQYAFQIFMCLHVHHFLFCSILCPSKGKYA